MCEIYGTTETELDWDLKLTDHPTHATFNGQKYEVTHLPPNAKLSHNIYKPTPHEYTLQNRTITNSPINPMGTEVSVKGGVSWGDSEGAKLSGGGSVKYSNEKGDSAKIEAQRSSTGRVDVEVEVHYKEKE